MRDRCRFVSVASDDSSEERSKEIGSERKNAPEGTHKRGQEYFMGLPPVALDTPREIPFSTRLPAVLLAARTASGHMSQPSFPQVLSERAGAASWSARNQLSSVTSEDGVYITLVACCDLPRKDAAFQDDAIVDPYVSISLVETSTTSPFSVDDVYMMDHDVSSITLANMEKAESDGIEGNEKALSKIRALFCSKIKKKDANPVWNETLVLNQAFLAADLRQPFDFRRPVVPKARIKGQNVLLLLTGRVVLPSLSCGQVLSDWFPLQAKDGVDVIGESGRKALVKLKIEYKVKSQLSANHIVTPRHCPQAEEAGAKALCTAETPTPAIKIAVASRVDPTVVPEPVEEQSFMKTDHDRQTKAKCRRSWMQRRQRALNIYSEEQLTASPKAETLGEYRDYPEAMSLPLEDYVADIGAQNGHSIHERSRTAQNSSQRHRRSPAHSSFGNNSGEDACERMDYVLKIVVAEARFLPSLTQEQHGTELQKPDTLVCITLVSQPELMQHEHFIHMGHYVRSDSSNALKTSSVRDEYFDNESDELPSPLFFPAQEQTHVFKASSNPSWNSTLHLTQSYPNIRAIEAASGKGKLDAFGTERLQLDGSAVLLLVTLHAVDGDSIHTLGKVLIPFVSLGTRVDQWFVLQDQKGEPLASHTILPPAVRLQVHYLSAVTDTANASRIFTSPHPSHAHAGTSKSGGRQKSSSSPSAIMLTPRASGSKYQTTTLSPALSALKLHIMEVRDIEVSDEMLSTSTSNVKLQFFLNLFDYQTIETLGPDAQIRMNHVVSEQQEPNLKGGNFVATNSHFLLRPQCATKCQNLSAGGASWNDEFCLYSVYPCLETLYRSFKSGKMRMLEQEIVLRAQPVIAFLTLQMVEDLFVSKLAHATINIDHGMSGSESWHPLFLPSGDPMVGPRGRAAMVQIAVEWGQVFGEKAFSSHKEGQRRPSLDTTLRYTSAPRQEPKAASIRDSTPTSTLRVSPCVQAKLHVTLFEGRNFTMLRQPEAGCRILCEIVLQRHGCEDKVARTSTVSDDSAPNFAGEEFHFEVEAATLETAVLKVNVILVRLHTKERCVKRIGKARRIRLRDVIRQGTLLSWFDVEGQSGAGCDTTSQRTPSAPLSGQEERRPSTSPFQTLKDEKARRLLMMGSYAYVENKDTSFANRRPIQHPGTPHHKSLDKETSPWSRIDLEGDSSTGSNYMTVDMLLSDDESHNDRMLRAELNMQRLQFERRIHGTQSDDYKAAIRMQIRYEPLEVPSSAPKTPSRIVESEHSNQLSKAPSRDLSLAFSSPADKSPLKLGGVGICFRMGPKGEHLVDYLIQGGAAERSGKILPGDTLMDVDGRPVSKQTIQEVQLLLRGEVSHPVSMTFLRSSLQGPFQVIVTVLRQALNPASPSAKLDRRPAVLPHSSPMMLATASIQSPRLNLSQGAGQAASRGGSVFQNSARPSDLSKTSHSNRGATALATNREQAAGSTGTVSQQDLTLARFELAAMAEGKMLSTLSGDDVSFLHQGKAGKIVVAGLM